jgi:hypothetical protein
LPEEDPVILARILIWLYSTDESSPVTTEKIEKTLTKLIPKKLITERSELETNFLLYFCAERLGIESIKPNLAREISSEICHFEKEDMNGDFAAFVEKMYNDIPSKNDPLRTQVTVQTLGRLWRLQLLDVGDSDDDGDDDGDKDASKRIEALIRANEPSALEIAIDVIDSLKAW